MYGAVVVTIEDLAPLLVHDPRNSLESMLVALRGQDTTAEPGGAVKNESEVWHQATVDSP